MTASRFRWLVGAWVVLYGWWWGMPSRVYKESEAVLAAMEHAGKGAILPPSDALANAFLIVTLAVAIGLVLFQPWARWTLLAITVVSVVLSPLNGVMVTGPFDGTLGYASTLLHGLVLAGAWSEPVSRRFGARRTEAEPLPESELVPVLETSDPAAVPAIHARLAEAGVVGAVTFMVRREDVIVAKDVLELAGDRD